MRALPSRPWTEWLAAQPVHVETDDERLARLAALNPLDYDRCRKAEAAAAGVQPRVLDAAVKQYRGKQADADDTPDFLADPEPWPEPVDGAALLDRIVDAVNAHMIVPKGAAAAVALWVMHAHAHDCFMISPVLGITSPTPECGKTTLLTMLGALVPRALQASNLTTSVAFRAVDVWGPTLLIDEADTFLSENDEMRGILNSGHQKSSAYVLRSVDTGSDHEPRRYKTWAPKAIAMIGKMPATLTSRAIRIELQRKRPGANVKPLRADRLDHLTPLQQQAARWVADNQIRLATIDPDMPGEIGNRTADNWRPLIAIADAAGGEWPERARKLAIGDRVPVQELGIMLLEDVKKVFEEERADRLPSTILANKLVLEEDRPWVEYHHGKPITPRQIAELLEPFKIFPKNIRLGTLTPKGYMLKQFSEAFATYTPDFAATTPQTSENNGLGEKKSATDDDVWRQKNADKPLFSQDCGAVADRKPPEPAIHEITSHLRCDFCGEGERSGDQLVPFLNGAGGNYWVHQGCHKPWIAARQAGASANRQGSAP